MKTIKLILMSVCVMLFLNASKAQDNPVPTGYISVNGGAGIPLGDFGGSGFALTGSNFNLSAAMPLKHSRFGLSAKFDFGDNGYDIQSFVNALAKDPNVIYQAQSNGHYSFVTAMIGGFYTIPLKKCAIDFRVMVGIMNSTMPDIAAGAKDSTGTVSLVGFTTASSTSFAFNLGGAFRYSITPKICGILSLDYLASNASYPSTQETYVQDASGNWAYQKSPVTVGQAISLFNVTAGIGWQFGK